MSEYLSTQAVMALAATSAFSRAGLNLIDRHQIGINQLSIIQLSIYNNAVPALFLAALSTAAGAGQALVDLMIDWRCATFGALIQAVAYGFSHGFRRMNVSQVTVAAKTADLFIPIGVYVTTKQWEWTHYAFATLTTTIYLPLLHLRGRSEHRPPIAPFLAICILLVVQGTAAPWLNGKSPEAFGIREAMLFSTAVMLWRTIWSLLPAVRATRATSRPPWALLANRLSGLRALLTAVTQLTFILSISGPDAPVAWPILNSSGLVAIALGAWLLKEKMHRYQITILLAVLALSVGQFLLAG